MKLERQWLTPQVALTRYSKGGALSARLEFDQDTRSGMARYGFEIGDIGLLVPRNYASEIVDHLPVYPFPNSPRWFVGISNFRGNIVPVYDLFTLLDLEPPNNQKRFTLIVGSGDAAFGQIITSVPRPLNLNPDLVPRDSPHIPEILSSHVIETYVVDGRAWIDLKYEDFFLGLQENRND